MSVDCHADTNYILPWCSSHRRDHCDDAVASLAFRPAKAEASICDFRVAVL